MYKIRHNYPTISLLHCQVAKMCSLERFDSLLHHSPHWIEPGQYFNCLLFQLTRQSFERHYASRYHRRPPFLKRVFRSAAQNTGPTACSLHGIEFSHPGMKSSVFDKHSERSNELLLTPVVNIHSRKALRKSHQNKSLLSIHHTSWRITTCNTICVHFSVLT